MAGMENIYDILAKENEEYRQVGIDYSKIREGGVAAAVMAQAGGMLGGSVMQAAGFKTAAQKTQEGRDQLRQRHPNPTTYQDMVAMANDAKNLGLSGDWEQIMKRAEAMKTTAKAPPVFESKINKINLLDIPQAEKDAMIKKVLAGTDGTTINMGAGSESSFAKKLGETQAPIAEEMISGAKRALESIGDTQQVSDLLATGTVTTGFLAEARHNLNRGWNLIFDDKELNDKVTHTELVSALLGRDVFPMIKQLGIGARGLDTPAERKFLMEVMTGTRDMNEDTLKEMTRIRNLYSRNLIERYNKKIDNGYFDSYNKSSQLGKAVKIEIPELVTLRPEGAKRMRSKTTGAIFYQYPDGKLYTPNGKAYK